ncbi:energy transducer TonB, partial [Klebsiella pneumoniae]|nr:energy transducer TonB [Klebsiella pneumoniae]
HQQQRTGQQQPTDEDLDHGREHIGPPPAAQPGPSYVETAAGARQRALAAGIVVHLRIVVDARGQPRAITLARSSGFARLDEQALL